MFGDTKIHKHTSTTTHTHMRIHIKRLRHVCHGKYSFIMNWLTEDSSRKYCPHDFAQFDSNNFLNNTATFTMPKLGVCFLNDLCVALQNRPCNIGYIKGKYSEYDCPEGYYTCCISLFFLHFNFILFSFLLSVITFCYCHFWHFFCWYIVLFFLFFFMSLLLLVARIMVLSSGYCIKFFPIFTACSGFDYSRHFCT